MFWVVCDAADFMDLAEPGVCCLSQIHDNSRQCLALTESVRAALDIKLYMLADGDDPQRDYPVAETGCESDFHSWSTCGRAGPRRSPSS